MIQVYVAGNMNFDMNGDSVVTPKSCKLHAKLNGSWELKMEHPLDISGKWKYIEENGVIAAPTFQGEKQLFRIDKLNKKNTGITVTAYPIFFDSANDCFLLDNRPIGKTGQEALNMMMAGSKYSGKSDITAVSTAYFVRRNLMSAINGSEDPSFIKRWGGEILYDNYRVIINERVGGDYGYEARYGKNMKGIDYQIDMSEVTTRIIPVAYNGHMLSGTRPWVDSPHISKYPKIYTREIKFDDVKLTADAGNGEEETFDTLADLQKELVRRCNKMYEEGADVPKVAITIDMVDLSKTKEYEQYQNLEKVALGDTVHCYNSKLDITTEERVVEITWDCIRNTSDTVVLGGAKYDYFKELTYSLDAISGIIGPGNTVIAEKIQGFLNATKTQLRLQNTVAKKQDVRAILFEDLDPESELFGAMSLGTQGLQIAKRRTADNRDWDWTTALTANGLIANIIVAGILSDKKGKNYWNLDTGEFSLSATGFKINGVTADKYFKDNWTQEEIFNKLTNNGQNAGIYLKNGRLYINADYIDSGILAGLTIISKGKGFIGSVSRSLYTKMEGGRYWFGHGDINDGMTEGRYNSNIANFGNGIRFIAPLDDVSSDNITEFSPQFAFFFQPEKNSNQAYSVFSMVPSRSRGNLPREYRRSYGTAVLKGNLVINPITTANDSNASNMEDAAKYGIGWANGVDIRDPSVNYGIYPIVIHKGYSNASVSGTGIEGPLICESVKAVSLSVEGYKSRISDTDNYGKLHQYCYEMPTPYFGDIGSGTTDENGECYISIDDKFSEACSDCRYYVFLQKEGMGDVWIEKKEKNYFIVKGTPNVAFSWEVKQSKRVMKITDLML